MRKVAIFNDAYGQDNTDRLEEDINRYVIDVEKGTIINVDIKPYLVEKYENKELGNAISYYSEIIATVIYEVN